MGWVVDHLWVRKMLASAVDSSSRAGSVDLFTCDVVARHQGGSACILNRSRGIYDPFNNPSRPTESNTAIILTQFHNEQKRTENKCQVLTFDVSIFFSYFFPVVESITQYLNNSLCINDGHYPGFFMLWYYINN